MAAQLYTIDLLKGQGIPKRKQKGLFIAIAAAMVIPAIIFIFMLAQYTTASILLPMKKTQLDKLAEQFKGGKGAKIEQQISEYNKCLAEITKTVNQQAQWSGVIEQAVAAMPATMVMENLNVTNETTVEKIPSKTEKGKVTTNTKIKRILNVTLFSEIRTGADASLLADVNKYIENVKKTCRFAGEIKKQETQDINGAKVKKYYIQFYITHES